MIEYLSGILIQKDPNVSIVDVNGIGYKINITNNSYESLPNLKSKVKFLIFFHVYENGQELYGFIDKDERYLFMKLISISGIGPKTAINMLSVLPPLEFKNRLVSGEVKLLTSLPGIGPKTAKRIIVELKDDLGSFDDSNLYIDDNSNFNDASVALTKLGFSSNIISESIRKVVKENSDLTTEEIIRETLKILK